MAENTWYDHQVELCQFYVLYGRNITQLRATAQEKGRAEGRLEGFCEFYEFWCRMYRSQTENTFSQCARERIQELTAESRKLGGLRDENMPNMQAADH